MLYLILGMLVGALILIAASVGLKWLVMVCLILAGLLVLAIVGHRYRNLEGFLIVAFIPLSSLRIDVHLLRIGGEPAIAITPLHIVWGLLMILWLVRIRGGESKVSWRSVFAVPLLVIFVGTIIAGARSHSLLPGIRFIVLMFQCTTLFLYLLNRQTNEREARVFYWAICLTLGAQSLLGVLQGVTGSTFGAHYLGGGQASYLEGTLGGVSMSRVGGTIGFANSYGLYLSSLIFVPLAAMVAKRSGLSRTLGTLAFFLGVVALVMSKSRGSWVGFGLCFLLLVFVLLREWLGAPRAAFAIVCLAMISSALVLITPATRQRLVTDDYGAARSRIPMAKTAVNMIAHNPVLGVGKGNYMRRFHEYDRTPEGHTYRFRFPVHNAFLWIAAETGIPVLLAYVAVLLAFWRAVFRLPSGPENQRSRTLAVGLGMGVLAQAIIWQVELAYPVATLFTWFLLGLAYSLSLVGRDEIVEGGDPTQPRLRSVSGPGRGL